MSDLRMRAYAGRALLPSQRTLAISNAWIKTAVGGYGSGKTHAGAIAFARAIAQNPWTEAYGGDAPQGIVCGPTRRVINESSKKALRLLIGDAIKREYKQDDRWIMRGGFEILFRSVEGAIEGANLCALWLDEAHLLPPDAWPNLQMRVREVRAANRLVLVTGLPEFGWLQDAFGRPEHYADPERCIVHCSTLDNRYLDPRVLEQLRSSIGAADADAYLLGKWRSADNAVLYAYEPAVHIVADHGDRLAQTHVSADVGNRAAIIFFQVRERIWGKTIHVVDELVPDNVSTEDAMRVARARGWKIDENSMVFVDPKTNIDQTAAIRKVIGPKTQIIRKSKGAPGYDIDEGLRAMNAALKSADGRVRLTFSDALPRDKRSLLTAMPKVRRKVDGDGMVKDNMTDHVIDALRYPVVHLLPLRRTGIEIRSIG